MARGFRNLEDLDLTLPSGGAVFLGPNGHGKTNLLELLYYPVLFRSLRGARDTELVRHGEQGFSLTLTLAEEQRPRELAAAFRTTRKDKQVWLDGALAERTGEALGRWLAVAFLPTDLRLVQGPASERRRYLDRVLSLAEPAYLSALTRYRRALAQRNAALRGRRPELAAPFDSLLAQCGSELVRRRLAWVERCAARFAEECAGLGELEPMSLEYRGDSELADAVAWPALLARQAARDLLLGMTSVGPHRHDLALRLGGRPLRDVGSTGQQRTAAVALKLCERATLASGSGSEPALLLDDVFAELDRDRQARLAARLAGGGERGAPQTFITTPREDELPGGFHLEPLVLSAGRVAQGAVAGRLVA